VDGEIGRIDQKLGNKDFLTRAPEEVVEELREKRAEYEAQKAKLVEALKRLE
jgi:valyl-tRNA synthetase